jgi:hypothetical protein
MAFYVNYRTDIFQLNYVADLDISTLQPKMSKKIRSRTSMGGGFSGGGGGPGGSLRANEKQGDGPPVELENQMILR